MKSTFIGTLFSASLIAAHGIVYQVNIAGKNYKGNVAENPSVASIDSIIREVSTQNPVKGAMNPDVNCGASSQKATLSATANPGDVIQFDWREANLAHWPHNIGPMLNYLASCGDSTCDQFDSSQAQWFKFHQEGRLANGSWVQQHIQSGQLASATLPTNIKPGNYLLRHEIIALHLGTTKGGAEFYPACIQLTITGSGTGVPTDAELVSLPGAYSDTDPGILDANVFDDGSDYYFPGPPVAAFVGNDAATDQNPNDIVSVESGVTTATAGAPAASSTSTASSSSSSSSGSSSGSSGKGQCRLKRPSSSTSSNSTSNMSRRASYNGHGARPRRFSRIMRDLKMASSGLF